MRPKKSVLLMSDDCGELARLRFVVSTKMHYQVSDKNPVVMIVKLSAKCSHAEGCRLIVEALKSTGSDGRFLPVLCEVPIELFESLRIAFLERLGMRLSLTEKRIESFERLDWVTSRKRGPKKKVRPEEVAGAQALARTA